MKNSNLSIFTLLLMLAVFLSSVPPIQAGNIPKDKEETLRSLAETILDVDVEIDDLAIALKRYQKLYSNKPGEEAFRRLITVPEKQKFDLLLPAFEKEYIKQGGSPADLKSEKQVYHLIHRYADRRGLDEEELKAKRLPDLKDRIAKVQEDANAVKAN